MHKALNIITILLLLSVIGVYLYVFAIPWFKGTMVKSNDPHCGMNASEKCKNGSYCCRDPRQGGVFCLSVPCEEARLVQPKENQVNFFKIYSMCVIGIIVIIAIITAAT